MKGILTRKEILKESKAATKIQNFIKTKILRALFQEIRKNVRIIQVNKI